MDWKLVFLLSMFGLATAIGSVFVIPPSVEPPIWPAIFLIVAFLVARRAPGRYFLHGFFVGLANWFWVAAAHVVFFDAYAARHTQELAAMAALPMPSLPPWAAQVVHAWRSRAIPIPGASGVIIGALCWVASRVPALRAAGSR